MLRWISRPSCRFGRLRLGFDSDQVVSEVEELTMTLSEGPGVEALEGPVLVADLDTPDSRSRWPIYAAAVAAARHLARANAPQPLAEPVFGRPTAADLVEAYVRTGHALPDPFTRCITAPVPDDFPAVAAAVWRCRGLVETTDAADAFWEGLTPTPER
jgi:hypothetical protein